MSTDFTIQVNNEESKRIEGRPITIVVHKDEMRVGVFDADVVEIGPLATLRVAGEISEEEWTQLRNVPTFQKKFSMVFTDMEIPVDLRQSGTGVRHVVGMIVLIVQCIVADKRPFVRFPESYLHPSAQRGIVDMINSFIRQEY